MSKRRKKKGKRDRRRRMRRDERIAQVALEKWLAVQESAVLMSQDMSGAEKLPGELVSDNNGIEVRMSGSTVSFGNSSEDSWLSQRVSEACREANIFIMDPEQYGTYSKEADVYATEVVADHDWSLIRDGDPANQWFDNEEVARQRYDAIMGESRTVHVPDPERWPFEAMWISFGGGFEMTLLQMAARLQRETMTGMGMRQAKLLGQLWTMTDQGPLIVEAMEFVSFNDETGPVVGICWSTAYSPEHEHGWAHPYDLNPWICNAIHKHLLDFRTFVIEREWRPHQRTAPDIPPLIERKPIPKPYYLVKLKSQVIRQGFRSALPPRRRFEYQHQFPVRGHERVRIRRGEMPMPAETRELLEQRRYTIYTLNPMSPDHARMLLERGIPVKRANEWLAILVSWVKDHMRGPEDGPFVPSVRLA